MNKSIEYRVLYRPRDCEFWDVEMFVCYKDAIDFLNKALSEGLIVCLINY